MTAGDPVEDRLVSLGEFAKRFLPLSWSLRFEYLYRVELYVLELTRSDGLRRGPIHVDADHVEEKVLGMVNFARGYSGLDPVGPDGGPLLDPR